MKRTRHTPEQIIRKLRQADAYLARGATIEEICRDLASARRRTIDGARSTAA